MKHYNMNYREIQETFSVYDVATRTLGLTLRAIGGGQYRGVSVAQGVHHTKDAFSISTGNNTWYDFSAQTGGKALELVAFVKYGNTEKEAIKQAAHFLAGDDYDSSYWSKAAEQRDKFRKEVDEWHEALLKDTKTLDYLHSRRISDDTIKRYKIGLGNLYIKINNELVREWRLTCPYLDGAGNPVYMASRSLAWAAHDNSPKYHKTKQNDFLKNQLFGYDTIPQKDNDCDTLVITEGMFDTLSAIQAGYSALSGISGFSNKDIPEVARIARRFRKVIMTFDHDQNKSGQNFTIQTGKTFLREGLNFYVVQSFGEGNKDLSDYYTQGGDIQRLLDTAISGYKFMAGFTFWAQSANDLHELNSYYPFSRLSANEKATHMREVKRFVHELDRLSLREIRNTRTAQRVLS